MDGRTRPLGLCCPGPAACEPSGRGHHPHPRPRPGVASSFPRAAPRHRPTPPGRARTRARNRSASRVRDGSRAVCGVSRFVARRSLDEESPDSGEMSSRHPTANRRRRGAGSLTPASPRRAVGRRTPIRACPSGTPPHAATTRGPPPSPNIATTLSRLAVSLVKCPTNARLPRRHQQPSRRLRRRYGCDAGAVRPHRRGLRRPAGQVPRGADPAPPGRHRGRPPLDGRIGCRGRRDRHLPGQPAQARRVGSRGPHARDQPQGGRDRAQGRRRGAVRRGLDRPDRPPARLGRPDPRADHVPRALRGLRRAGAGPPRGRRRPADHRDRAGHPRGQGVDLRRPRGVQARRALRADPGVASRCCRRAARCSSAPTSRAR